MLDSASYNPMFLLLSDCFLICRYHVPPFLSLEGNYAYSNLISRAVCLSHIYNLSNSSTSHTYSQLGCIWTSLTAVCSILYIFRLNLSFIYV